MRYQVVVGNVGTVTDTDDEAVARKDYDSYRELSILGYGRAGDESVSLFEDGELVIEYHPAIETQ